MKNRSIAFYLPQFHPIPENDEWWGKGFTEWTNVAPTQPRFPGHHQPQIPADLGFYDLRLKETRVAQAELAKKFGLYGFCYYHYWFNGKLLLESPLEAVLKDPEPDFPFCICWANENWTRAWDGLDRQVLIKQEYSDSDARDHIGHLLRIFSDVRYIKVDDKPLVLIYRPDVIPNLSRLISLWRDISSEKFPGGIYVAGVRNGFSKLTESEYISAGFDAIVDFQPNRDDFPPPSGVVPHVKTFLQRYLPDFVYQRIKLSASVNNVVDYEAMVHLILKKAWPSSYVKFPCVFPSWDNSARRKSATIIQNDNPGLFLKWLIHAVSSVSGYKPQERIVFINAWNEWAEGCHLEPDRKFGYAFLDAVKKAFS